jgi:hypothetical protein
LDFPAAYENVFSVASLSRNNGLYLKEKIKLVLPNESFYTTYLNNKYIKTKGSSISTAIVSAIAALIIEKNNKKFSLPLLDYELKNIFK